MARKRKFVIFQTPLLSTCLSVKMTLNPSPRVDSAKNKRVFSVDSDRLGILFDKRDVYKATQWYNLAINGSQIVKVTNYEPIGNI